MELDKRNIEEYINRFLEGETTNAEEQAIYRFFHTGDVPSHLMGYAPMFAWYEGGMQGEPGMSQPDGQEEVAGGKRSEKVPVVGKEGFYQRIPVAVWSAGIAAMMVIALGLGLISIRRTKQAEVVNGRATKVVMWKWEASEFRM